MYKNLTSLQTDGIVVFPEMYNSDLIKKVNDELDTLMNTPSINGSSGYIHLGRYYKSLQLPTIMIRSINLLELAIDIKIKIDESLDYCDNYKLTNINVFEERKKTTPLFWHTDQRKAMLRAFLYLEGGSEDSGALNYMKGTQKGEYDFHKLSSSQINENSSNIFMAKAPIGSVVLFNTNGFHSNQPRIKQRRVVMFEFQPKKSTFVKSSVFISSFQLTDKVKDNIDLFENGVDSFAFAHGVDERLGNVITSLGVCCSASINIIVYVIKLKLTHFIKRALNKLHI
jgi:hypothetical protein